MQVFGGEFEDAGAAVASLPFVLMFSWPSVMFVGLCIALPLKLALRLRLSLPVQITSCAVAGGFVYYVGLMLAHTVLHGSVKETTGAHMQLFAFIFFIGSTYGAIFGAAAWVFEHNGVQRLRSQNRDTERV
jgi:hypothetical protein